MTPLSARTRVLLGLTTFVGYVATGWAGLQWASVADRVTLIWLPSGIALAALVRFHRSLWPAITLGSFVVNVVSGGTVLQSALIAGGATAAALFGAARLRPVATVDPPFHRRRSVGQLAWWGSIVSPCIAATAGTAALLITGDIAIPEAPVAWGTWWAGNGVGVLVAAPLTLTVRSKQDLGGRVRSAEAWLLFTLFNISLLFSYGGLGTDLLGAELQGELWFVPLPLFVIICIRRGPPGASLATVFAVLLVVIETTRGVGPLARIDPEHVPVVLWALSACVAFTSLAISSLMVEQREAVDAMVASQQRLAVAHQLARFGTWEVDLQTGASQWSPETFDIIGVPHDETPRFEALLERTVAEDREPLLAARGEAIAQDGTFDREFRIGAPDGIRYLRTMATVVRRPDGRRTLNGAIQDITERRRAELQLVEAQKLDALGTLAAGIAHDFNNVLLAVSTHAEIVAEHVESAEGRRSMAQIEKSTAHARDLVGQILTFARGGEGDVRPVDVRDPIAAAVQMLRSSLPASFEVGLSSPESPLVVECDRAELERVVLNLVTNAHQAAGDRGQAEVLLDAVDVSTAEAARMGVERGRYVRLSVRDRGPGIPEPHLSRIFEPFFTTKAVNEGTGLGLSVVHGIVTRLGGTVCVESTVGEGTTFECYFPISASVPARAREPARAVARGGIRVVVVDDELPVLRGLSRLLRSRDFEVTTFDCSDEALEHLIERPYEHDVLLTDRTMPGMSGPELARSARKVRPDLPVVLMTGYSGAEDDGEERSYDALILKPFATDDLVRCLGDLVAEQRPAD